MRRILGVFLAAVLSMSCLLSPALAAEFSDVDDDAWYAQGVALCAEKSVMIGTGEDTFSPEEPLSYNQCLTLGLRLYDLLQGGDGVLPQAPEDWAKPTVTLTLADGTQLSGQGWGTAPLPGLEGAVFQHFWGGWRHEDYGYLCAELDGAPELLGQDYDAWQAAQQACYDWGKAHEGPATVTVGELTVTGTVNCWLPLNAWVLAFHPDDGDHCPGGAAIHDALYSTAPAADAWWRDGAYYLSRHEELQEQSYALRFWDIEDGPATRWDFTEILYAVTGEPPAVRTVDIPDVDRESEPHIYALYEAGILTGTDVYGTFDGAGSFTRAQAAVMVARVLDESLRVTEPLAPLPTEGYTLTYLMDGQPDCGVIYPVCALAEQNVILTLDGRQLPWPKGGWVPSWGLETYGDHLYYGVYDESTEDPYDIKVGLMDRNGEFVVPMGSVPAEDFREVYPPKARQSYLGIEAVNHSYYVDASGVPASQKFDWCGPVTEDGQGFVGLDEKIYRIDFAT